MAWVSELSQDSLSPIVFLCLSDWLLLQTPQLVFEEGETIKLRCHRWRNLAMSKIIFYQNGKSVKYQHSVGSFSISKANHSHSGEYYCTARLGKSHYTSKPVTITVQGMGTLSRCWKGEEEIDKG